MGQKEAAIKDLNTLLKSRYKRSVYQPLTVNDFSEEGSLLERLLEERRLETAFDGSLRFFDLRRLGKPEVIHYYTNNQEFILKENDPKYVLQIPQSESINSPEMELNPR